MVSVILSSSFLLLNFWISLGDIYKEYYSWNTSFTNEIYVPTGVVQCYDPLLTLMYNGSVTYGSMVGYSMTFSSATFSIQNTLIYSPTYLFNTSFGMTTLSYQGFGFLLSKIRNISGIISLTVSCSTQAPTSSPTRLSTYTPTTPAPTQTSTRFPTRTPTTQAPTHTPTTQAPTRTPTTQAPTHTPTNQITTTNNATTQDPIIGNKTTNSPISNASTTSTTITFPTPTNTLATTVTVPSTTSSTPLVTSATTFLSSSLKMFNTTLPALSWTFSTNTISTDEKSLESNPGVGSMTSGYNFKIFILVGIIIILSCCGLILFIHCLRKKMKKKEIHKDVVIKSAKPSRIISRIFQKNSSVYTGNNTTTNNQPECVVTERNTRLIDNEHGTGGLIVLAQENSVSSETNTTIPKNFYKGHPKKNDCQFQQNIKYDETLSTHIQINEILIEDVVEEMAHPEKFNDTNSILTPDGNLDDSNIHASTNS